MAGNASTADQSSSRQQRQTCSINAILTLTDSEADFDLLERAVKLSMKLHDAMGGFSKVWKKVVDDMQVQ
jgi:hypothetical protein